MHGNWDKPPDRILQSLLMMDALMTMSLKQLYDLDISL